MAKETVPNRRYTDEFKLEALRLAESMGINQLESTLFAGIAANDRRTCSPARQPVALDRPGHAQSDGSAQPLA